MKNLLCILFWILLGVLDLYGASFGQSIAFQGASAVRPTAGGGGGGIAYVQGGGAQSTDGNTVTKSFTGTPTAGTTVIVAATAYGSTMSGTPCTDNQGNSYGTPVALVTNVANSCTAFFVCNNVASSGTFTVTFAPGAGTYPAIHISEWSGVNNSTVVTDTSGTTATSTSPAPGTITSPTSGYILAVCTHADGTSPTITPPGGWTNPYEAETSSGNSLPISMIYKSSSTDETPVWTIGTSANWAASAIAIQP